MKTCDECLWFLLNTNSETTGECRRFPPKETAFTGSRSIGGYTNDSPREVQIYSQMYSFFPSVDIKTWCGEFKENNTKGEYNG